MSAKSERKNFIGAILGSGYHFTRARHTQKYRLYSLLPSQTRENSDSGDVLLCEQTVFANTRPDRYLWILHGIFFAMNLIFLASNTYIRINHTSCFELGVSSIYCKLSPVHIQCILIIQQLQQMML